MPENTDHDPTEKRLCPCGAPAEVEQDSGEWLCHCCDDGFRMMRDKQARKDVARGGR